MRESKRASLKPVCSNWIWWPVPLTLGCSPPTPPTRPPVNLGSSHYAPSILAGFILPLAPQTYRCFRVGPRRTPQSQPAHRAAVSLGPDQALVPTVASGPLPPLGDTECSLLLPPQPSTLIASSPESFSFPSNCLCRGYTYSMLGSQAEHYRDLSFQPAPATWPRPSRAPLVTSPVQKVHRNPGSLSQAPGKCLALGTLTPQPSANLHPHSQMQCKVSRS